MTAIVALIFYFVYCYSLGAASVLAYRYSSSSWRVLPGVLVLLYYVLALIFPHWVIQQALTGTTDQGADLRFIVGCLGLFLALHLLSAALNKEKIHES